MDSNIIWIIILIVIVIVTNLINSKLNSNSKAEDSKKNYRYYLRKNIMTERERAFFKTLNEIFADEYYVLPQVGLSTLLHHEIRGQNWNGAFQHINRKTVDYVLLSKTNMNVICAIGLDDSSHDRASRIKRDEEVERIFESVKLPLVRFRNVSQLTKQEIVNEIAKAIKA